MDERMRAAFDKVRASEALREKTREKVNAALARRTPRRRQIRRRVVALDPSITPEEVAGSSMRALRQRLADLGGQLPESGQQSGGHHGENGHHRGWDE